MGRSLSATQYSLDGRNNWLTRWNGSTNAAYARDARDALTAIGAQAVSSDETGAITGDGSATYRYDALGLLSEVRPVAGGGRIYKRDALGRIVSEIDLASGGTTRFAWDGAQRVAVQRPDGALETTLAAEGLDQPVVTIFASGSRRYFHQDRQGSVYAQTDDYGAGQLFISYNAYGEPSLRDGSGRALHASGVWSNFGYHGLPHDFGLGLVDMRARTYRPTLGRFLSPDPIGLLGDANLFAFVNSGPLSWRDPWGLAAKGAGRVWGNAWDDWTVGASIACLEDPSCSPSDDRNGVERFFSRLGSKAESYGDAVVAFTERSLDPSQLPQRLLDQSLLGVRLAQGAWQADQVEAAVGHRSIEVRQLHVALGASDQVDEEAVDQIDRVIRVAQEALGLAHQRRAVAQVRVARITGRCHRQSRQSHRNGGRGRRARPDSRRRRRTRDRASRRTP